MVFRRFQFRRSLLFLLGALALGLTGCSDNNRLTYTAEVDEPLYREGTSLLKTGRKQEALSAFLKVIDKRGEDSAESHLEVGLLYLQHINDPLSAIYHLKRYLALRPNSPQSGLVRQRIDQATRDFARTLPAQPLEDKFQRVDLVAALDKLKQENERLKVELADLKANRPTPVVAEPTEAPEPRAESAQVFSFNTVPTVRSRPTVPVATTINPPAPKPAVKPTPAPTAGGRRHVVRAGDTLSSIAQRYYQNRAKWRDILAANRGLLKTENDLKVGMELKIP